MSVAVGLCVFALRQTGELSSLYPTSHPMAAGLQPPPTPELKKWNNVISSFTTLDKTKI